MQGQRNIEVREIVIVFSFFDIALTAFVKRFHWCYTLYYNFCVVCIFLFCVTLCIVRVYMCTELLPPGGYPIAVKYIISYTP